MKITVQLGEQRHPAAPPFEGADHCRVPGVEKCPACGRASDEGGLRVVGEGMHVESHDTYASTGRALCCRKIVGTIRAKMSTIFGVEEDARVLRHGRARVY